MVNRASNVGFDGRKWINMAKLVSRFLFGGAGGLLWKNRVSSLNNDESLPLYYDLVTVVRLAGFINQTFDHTDQMRTRLRVNYQTLTHTWERKGALAFLSRFWLTGKMGISSWDRTLRQLSYLSRVRSLAKARKAYLFAKDGIFIDVKIAARLLSSGL